MKSRVQIPRSQVNVRWAWWSAFNSSLGRQTQVIARANWLVRPAVAAVSGSDEEMLPQKNKVEAIGRSPTAAPGLDRHAHTCTWVLAHMCDLTHM